MKIVFGESKITLYIFLSGFVFIYFFIFIEAIDSRKLRNDNSSSSESNGRYVSSLKHAIGFGELLIQKESKLIYFFNYHNFTLIFFFLI